MPHHLHILKAFEWIGQDIPFNLLVGHVLTAIEAVRLFDDQAPAAAIGVEAAEELDEVRKLHRALAVAACQHGQHHQG